MRHILIIGIGAGNPDYLTIQAVKALNRVNVVFIPDKGTEKAALRQLRVDICERFIERKTYRLVEMKAERRAPAPPDYTAGVAEWHTRIEEQYAAALTNELADGECGAFLVWGDPTLYDSTLRIVERIRAAGRVDLDYEIIPGISSVQALAARHRRPLNRIGEPVHITTGRRLAEGFPGGEVSVVVMLDGDQAFARIERDDLDIYWGAYLGTPDEILIAGRLSEVRDEILRRRERARIEKGWVMDTYLLRTSDD